MLFIHVPGCCTYTCKYKYMQYCVVDTCSLLLLEIYTVHVHVLALTHVLVFNSTIICTCTFTTSIILVLRCCLLACVYLQEYAKIIEDITYHELLILETLGELVCINWNMTGFIQNSLSTTQVSKCKWSTPINMWSSALVLSEVCVCVLYVYLYFCTETVQLTFYITLCTMYTHTNTASKDLSQTAYFMTHNRSLPACLHLQLSSTAPALHCHMCTIQ